MAEKKTDNALWNYETGCNISICAISAGPEYLINYIQKGALLGQKAALNLRYVDTKKNSQKLFLSI